MTASDVQRIHERLDEILASLGKLRERVAVLETQQKNAAWIRAMLGQMLASVTTGVIVGVIIGALM